jgi:hypothetical protein
MLNLKISQVFIEEVKYNIRFTSRAKNKEIYKRFPDFPEIYHDYLASSYFRRLFNMVRRKYDVEYQKLFLRNALNFLNIYLKENDPVPI